MILTTRVLLALWLGAAVLGSLGTVLAVALLASGRGVLLAQDLQALAFRLQAFLRGGH